MSSFDLNPDSVPFSSSGAIFDARPARRRGTVAADLEVQVLNVEGDSRIKVTSKDGESFFVPAEFIEVLAASTDWLTRRYHEGVDRAQMGFVGALATHGLTDHPLRDLKFVLATQSEPSADGVPFIRWEQRDGFDSKSKARWILGLNGSTAEFGEAEWDDIVSFKNLVAAMSDPESLVTFLAITDPTAASVLAAKMNARILKADKSLPSVSITKVREILGRGGLTLEVEGLASYHQGRARLLQIKNGDSTIRVAAALVAPWGKSRELTPSVERERDYKIRSRTQTALEEEFLQQWRAKATQAFKDAGWIIPELPKPRARANSPHSRVSVLWVSPFDPETWEKIDLGAKTAAERLGMGT